MKQEKRKVLYIVPTYFRARETLFIELSKKFDIKFIEVAYFERHGTPSDKFKTAVHSECWQLHGFKFRKGLKIREYFIMHWKIFRELQKGNYSAVISSTAFPVYADMVWFWQPFFRYKLLFVNEVWDPPKGILGKIHHWWVRIMMKRAAGILSRGKMSSKYLQENMSVSSGKIKRWPLLCEAPVLCDEELECERIFAECKNSVKFLYMGRFLREKGLFELLDSFEKLQKKYSNISLFLVGGNGKEEILLKERAEKIINCHVISWVAPKFKQKIYQACDVFVLPSYYDGYSTATLEAASCKLPVIITNQTGCWPDILQGDQNGSLIEAKSQDAIYNAMERWLLYSEAERKERGMISFEIFSNLSDPAIHCNSLNDILEAK